MISLSFLNNQIYISVLPVNIEFDFYDVITNLSKANFHFTTDIERAGNSSKLRNKCFLSIKVSMFNTNSTIFQHITFCEVHCMIKPTIVHFKDAA